MWPNNSQQRFCKILAFFINFKTLKIKNYNFLNQVQNECINLVPPP